jgi:glycosyltransferase involved in cell wall biosynthesis
MNFEQFKTKHLKKEVIEFPNKIVDKPFLSIIIQCYNQVEMIECCLENILKQNIKSEYEILLGDDQSTDGTREICIKYAEKYPTRVRLFLHNRENNISIDGRPTGRFNFLYNLFNARGTLIALCEGDDYWTWTGKLQNQIDFLDHNPDCLLCYHKVNKVQSQGVFTGKNHVQYNTPVVFNGKELFSQYIPSLSVVFRNNHQLYPDEFIKAPHADLLLFSLLISHGQFADMGIKSGVRRIHSSGIYSGLKVKDKLVRMIKTRVVISNTTEVSKDIQDAAIKSIRQKQWKLAKSLLKKGKLLELVDLVKSFKNQIKE